MVAETARFSRLTRSAALAGLVGQAVFTLAWICAGILQDGYSSRRQFISALAARDAAYAWFMIPAFLVLGASYVLFGTGLHLGLGRGSVVGPLLLVIAGVGIMIVGIARNDCSNGGPSCEAVHAAGNPSRSDQVHEPVAAVLFVSLALAPAITGRRLDRLAAWRDLRRWSLLATPVLFILLVEVATKVISSWAGAAQRLFVLVMFAWVIVMALRLWSESAAHPQNHAIDATGA